MRKDRKHAACVLLGGLIFASSSPTLCQEATKVPALGEVARHLKEERKKDKQKPVAVFTNDNLPREGSLGIVSGRPGKSTQEEGQTKENGASQADSSKEHGEKYFRSKAEEIRSQMEFHQRQLAVLRQKLGLARMQYYPDPQKTLDQESTPAFQTDLKKLRAKIAKAEKVVADDQKAMDDLQQELRSEGGDPGWIRQ